MIKNLVKKQNLLESLETSIKAKSSKLSSADKEPIQLKLNTALEAVRPLPAVVKNPEISGMKLIITQNIDPFKGVISGSSNSDTNDIKGIKKNMLDKIRFILGQKTEAAESAISNATSTTNYETMLQYADAVILWEKLILYVTNIMKSIQDKSLKADTLALPEGILDLALPEGTVASAKPKVTITPSIKSKVHKLIKQEEYVSMDYNTALTRFNACLEFVEKKKFLEVEIESKKNINVVQLFKLHQDTINQLIPSGILPTTLDSKLSEITREFDEYLNDLTIVNKLRTQILRNMFEGLQLIFIMKIKFFEEKKSDSRELLTTNAMFENLNKYSKTGIEDLIEYE